MESTLCKCGNKRASGGRYCLECKAAYMREWNKTHPISEEQKRKNSVRSKSRYLQRVGKIKRTPCVVCGAKEVERHHSDYDDPTNVTFLCRPCHRTHHKELLHVEQSTMEGI